MASVQNTDGEIMAINVTPLVDVTLVLLIIFMVTAKLIAGLRIRLDLPKSKTAGATRTVLNVASDADLKNRASRALRDNPELRAVIRACSALGPESWRWVVGPSMASPAPPATTWRVPPSW